MPTPKADTVCSLPTRVVNVDHVCREHVIVTVETGHLPHSRPGQFLQLQCREELTTDPGLRDWPSDGWPKLTQLGSGGPAIMLRRPFSIADRYPGENGDRISVISRAIGPGTNWLDQLQPGQMLDVTGPLGQGFSEPQTGQTAILIGGGVGIPPLLYFARQLHERGHSDVRVIFGVQSGDLLPVRQTGSVPSDGAATPCLQLPGDAPFASMVATDDGTLGLPGRVTDALEALHQREGDTWNDTIVYTCGPEPMLQAVASQTRALQLQCEICLERFMGCGLGTCLSCVVRVHDTQHAQGWRWALSCQEGPVFPRDRVLDYDD